MVFKFSPFELPGLLLVEGPRFPDERGFFLESFRESDLAEAGLPPFVQDNHSRSTKGVLRGLHYQKNPHAIGKLVRCARGQVYDVVVDIRKGSKTYGRWAGIELTDEKNIALWVPAGFAHGFYTVSDVADVIYKVTGYWSKDCDRGVLWNDSSIGIKWPSQNALLSPKDSILPPLSKADNNFEEDGVRLRLPPGCSARRRAGPSIPRCLKSCRSS
jgi:dTDP-4-dehydrorhamnose 3,5-epimerase